MHRETSEVNSSKQTEAENERLRLQHQGRIEAVNQCLRKQELERNQMIQQLHHFKTENQPDNVPEITEMIPPTSKKVPQQAAWSEFSIPTPFVFHVKTERQKWAFITDALSLTEIFVYNSTICLRFENTVMILIEFLWLETTMTFIYIKINLRLVK